MTKSKSLALMSPMTPNGQPSAIYHALQNTSLLFLSTFFIPLCTCIAILSKIISPFTTTTKNIHRHRKWRATSSATFQPRTVLVTGVGMSKGLFLARAFYQAGHRVIGADFEPYGIPVAGRFSVALDKFCRLSKPLSAAGKPDKYIDELLAVVKNEKIDVWVNCSGVASAIKDGEAAEALEKLTTCKPIQFGAVLTDTLCKKHSFIEHTRNLGLNVADTHLITSCVDAMKFFYLTLPVGEVRHKKYILKGVGLDHSIRTEMTLLPCNSSSETQKYLSHLGPSESRPFVLQQFVSGPEYCIHALIIRGRVLAFTASKSSPSDVLVHYKALPSSSFISKAMLEYTKTYARKTGPSMTGHFSIDFILDQTDQTQGKELMEKIHPIECNPIAHTAVVLFRNESRDLAEACLSVLPDYSSAIPTTDSTPKRGIITPTASASYYWIGNDLITLVILPFWAFASRRIDIWTFLGSWVEFVEHFLFWKDGIFEVWDPWPAWWLYCVYWPAMFLATLVTRKWWRRCNVSTSELFRY